MDTPKGIGCYGNDRLKSGLQVYEAGHACQLQSMAWTTQMNTNFTELNAMQNLQIGVWSNQWSNVGKCVCCIIHTSHLCPSSWTIIHTQHLLLYFFLRFPPTCPTLGQLICLLRLSVSRALSWIGIRTPCILPSANIIILETAIHKSQVSYPHFSRNPGSS